MHGPVEILVLSVAASRSTTQEDVVLVWRAREVFSGGTPVGIHYLSVKSIDQGVGNKGERRRNQRISPERPEAQKDLKLRQTTTAAIIWPDSRDLKQFATL
jgi:hypothetical protein